MEIALRADRLRHPGVGEEADAINIRVQADSGMPTVVADPAGKLAGIYKDVARQVAVKVAQKAKDFSAKFPSITISKNT